MAQQVYFEIGLNMGRQQIIDMLSLTLRDSEVVGKDTFGKDRLVKIIKGISNYLEIYSKAWEKDNEADYYRTKLDESLTEIYGSGFLDSFSDRYEFLSEFNYEKGRWK